MPYQPAKDHPGHRQGHPVSHLNHCEQSRPISKVVLGRVRRLSSHFFPFNGIRMDEEVEFMVFSLLKRNLIKNVTCGSGEVA